MCIKSNSLWLCYCQRWPARLHGACCLHYKLYVHDVSEEPSTGAEVWQRDGMGKVIGVEWIDRYAHTHTYICNYIIYIYIHVMFIYIYIPTIQIILAIHG